MGSRGCHDNTGNRRIVCATWLRSVGLTTNAMGNQQRGLKLWYSPLLPGSPILYVESERGGSYVSSIWQGAIYTYTSNVCGTLGEGERSIYQVGYCIGTGSPSLPVMSTSIEKPAGPPG